MLKFLSPVMQLIKARMQIKLLQDELAQARQDIKNLSGMTQHELLRQLYALERKYKKMPPGWPLIPDLYRLTDFERYPVYAPLVKYLQSIGAVGSPLGYWHLPNGMSLRILSNIGTNFDFTVWCGAVIQHTSKKAGLAELRCNYRGSKTWNTQLDLTPDQVFECVEVVRQYWNSAERVR